MESGNKRTGWGDVEGETNGDGGRSAADQRAHLLLRDPPVIGGGFDVSGAPEEPRIACTWCGLFSTPGFCDSCGSPLSTVGFSVGPLPEPVPVLAVGSLEEVPDPAEIFALVEDPTPLVEERAEPEPPEPTESLESPRVEALAREAETSQGPRCPSCGRAGGGGLCETCREAIRELSALSH